MPRKATFKCFRLQINIRDSSDRDEQVRLYTEEKYERKIDNHVDTYSDDNIHKQPVEPIANSASNKRKNEFTDFQQRIQKQKTIKQSKHEKLKALREHKDTPAAKVPRALPMPEPPLLEEHERRRSHTSTSQL